MPNPGPEFEHAEARGRLRRQVVGFGAVIVLMAILVMLVATTMDQAGARKTAQRAHVQTEEILLAASRLQLSIHAAGRSVRGFMLTNDPNSLDLFVGARRDGRDLIDTLQRLTVDRVELRAEVDAIGEQLDATHAMGDRLIALQSEGQRDAALAPLRSGHTERRMESLLARIDRLAQFEIEGQRRHAAAAMVADRRQDVLTYTLAGIAMLFLITAASTGIGAGRAHVRSVALAARLHHIAAHDELTGLLNRRSLFESLSRERERAIRSERPFAVAIVDVDHFKRINDTHGHQAGDLVLTHVAALIADTLRTTDLVGRIGGEEFAILMPDTEAREARAALERLRKTIARATVTLPSGIDAMLTISTGVALLGIDEPRDALVGRADSALYAAKSGGRNQVRLAA